MAHVGQEPGFAGVQGLRVGGGLLQAGLAGALQGGVAQDGGDAVAAAFQADGDPAIGRTGRREAELRVALAERGGDGFGRDERVGGQLNEPGAVVLLPQRLGQVAHAPPDRPVGVHEQQQQAVVVQQVREAPVILVGRHGRVPALENQQGGGEGEAKAGQREQGEPGMEVGGGRKAGRLGQDEQGGDSPRERRRSGQASAAPHHDGRGQRRHRPDGQRPGQAARQHHGRAGAKGPENQQGRFDARAEPRQQQAGKAGQGRDAQGGVHR